MAAIQNSHNQIMNRVIHCNGKHYTITTDDYPTHLQRNLNRHIEEVRSEITLLHQHQALIWALK